MPVYALWNNKGGVGKSYLTFQIACQYASTHPNERVLVLDVCPQANVSLMLFGGMQRGESALDQRISATPRMTIAGYIRERIASPYHNPGRGAAYLTIASSANASIPHNLDLVCGDEELEILASRVSNATRPGPDDAWAKVHRWFVDLIGDVRLSWNGTRSTVFIDCNPSFGIYTELAMSAADRLIIPFSADGSSRRAVRTVLGLIYGITRTPGAQQSEFFQLSEAFRMTVPKIYCYVGNRLTRANKASAKAFKTVVQEIGNEIWSVYSSNANQFAPHPATASMPMSRSAFRSMFQTEIPDANTASVVSGALGIPIVRLSAGQYQFAGNNHVVNQSQLDVQQPAIRDFVATIE